MDTLTIIRSAIKANVPLLLEGHTGTGKTYTIMQLAKELGKELHVINVSGELTVDSILGQQSLQDGNVTWHDGVLVHAMKNGDWVLFDEMNTALPEVLTVINGVLDDSRSVTLPNKDNSRVEAHKDFRFIGTQNPSGGDYAGTGRLNSALLNRMVRVEIGFMDPMKEVEALKTHSKLKDGTLSVLVSIADYTRRDRNGFSEPISTRDLVKIVRLRDNGGITLKDAITIVLKDKYEKSDYDRIQERYSDRMYTLEYILQCRNHEDPLDKMKASMAEVEDTKRALKVRENNLREEVRKELLQELLTGATTSTPTPEGF